ncbi:GPW/gp25 family protein (plasmid) [Lysinibacillus capsici]|uniref:Gene 25-like lysozyme n=1 Tax=Lysinibacillus capsici TaxID=2115968 RepID=A0A2X0XZ04_9BACI|nr:GPW/gp25 family protein [Lysinibacillus capsici]UYB50389.1 GPW/gp25 family protein [Lysinibacillus capsici]SPT95550.1 Gene 25-like lysozyme [Lysinibacillus capsici]
MYEVEPMKNIKFGATGVEEILQNVAFILATPIMSCPLDREFGWDTGIDEPIQIRKAKIVHDVTEAIGNFEPRAIVESVVVDGDGLAGKLTPRVKVRINDESI